MPKKTLTHLEKFQTAFGKVIAQEYDETVGKSQLTKIVNAWERTFWSR